MFFNYLSPFLLYILMSIFNLYYLLIHHQDALKRLVLYRNSPAELSHLKQYKSPSDLSRVQVHFHTQPPCPYIFTFILIHSRARVADWRARVPRDPRMLMVLIDRTVRFDNLCIIFDPVMHAGLCVRATLRYHRADSMEGLTKMIRYHLFENVELTSVSVWISYYVVRVKLLVFLSCCQKF